MEYPSICISILHKYDYHEKTIWHETVAHQFQFYISTIIILAFNSENMHVYGCKVNENL